MTKFRLFVLLTAFTSFAFAQAPGTKQDKKAEEILRGRKPDQEFLEKSGQAAVEEASPIDDIRGSADYRRELLAVLTKRAITQAIQQAEG